MLISAIILTKNEEKKLPRLLASLGWVDEIIVVDDLSSDRTLELARAAGAKIISHALQDFSSQTNLGLEQARAEWVLRLDADEEIPAETIPQLQAAMETAGPDIGGFRILRRNMVLGRWVRHGQEYGKRVEFYDWVRLKRGYRQGEYIGGAVKLFRRQGSHFVNPVHEEVVFIGQEVQLQAYVNHYTGESMHDIFEKVNLYTTLHARQLYEKNPAALPENYYYWLTWHPLKTFLNLYLRKRGCLDGFPGFVRCLASGWYELLKYLKLYDFYMPKRLAGQAKNSATRN